MSVTSGKQSPYVSPNPALSALARLGGAGFGLTYGDCLPDVTEEYLSVTSGKQSPYVSPNPAPRRGALAPRRGSG